LSQIHATRPDLSELNIGTFFAANTILSPPFKNMKRLFLDHPTCMCDFCNTPLLFGRGDLLRSTEIMFPALESLSLLGYLKHAFSFIDEATRHCPKLRKLALKLNPPHLVDVWRADRGMKLLSLTRSEHFRVARVSHDYDGVNGGSCLYTCHMGIGLQDDLKGPGQG